MTNLEKCLADVMEYLVMTDQLPGMPEEDIEEALYQYLHHSMIADELAVQIEMYNEYELEAIDYCEFILEKMEEDYWQAS